MPLLMLAVQENQPQGPASVDGFSPRKFPCLHDQTREALSRYFGHS
jgi:hypothetical protein